MLTNHNKQFVLCIKTTPACDEGKQYKQRSSHMVSLWVNKDKGIDFSHTSISFNSISLEQFLLLHNYMQGIKL